MASLWVFAPSAIADSGIALSHPGVDSGHSITLTSTASGASSWAWQDLTEPSAGFGNAAAETTSWTPSNIGPHTIQLQVDGGAPTTQVVNVSPDPVASFATSAPAADRGQKLSLTSTSTGDGLTYAWTDPASSSFGDVTGQTTSWTPTTAVIHHIQLEVTDANGVTDEIAHDVTVSDPPSASFTYSPANPVVGQQMSFHSTPGGTQEWDLSGSGAFTPASDPTWTPTAAGPHVVALRVTDANGVSAVAFAAFDVSTPPPPPPPPAPSAWFTLSPVAPVARQPVTLTSISTGRNLTQSWDLSGSGRFADAAGPTARWTPPSPGVYALGLRVTDDRGVSQTVWRTVSVAAAPAAPGWLVPFPIVVFSGRVSHRSVTFTRFVVEAPAGARIVARCRGGGCPRGQVVKLAARARGVQTVRLRALERRVKAGAVIELFIRRAGLIGKYTRISVVAGGSPQRTDSCLLPGAAKPSRCPAN